MFILPKTLLLFWSDYQHAVLDLTAILNAYLDRCPAVAPIHLDSQGILTHGVESDWTARHLEEATARLCAWCVRNGRYFANVSVPQEVKKDDAPLVCAPFAPHRQSFSLLSTVLFRASEPSRRIAGKLNPFTSHKLQERDLVLIDAPISIVWDGTKQEIYLCDFPPFLRKPDDACVPLRLSGGALDQLAARFADGAEWMPFCRILAVLRAGESGQVLDVLQIRARTPLYPEAGWSAGLTKEASDIQFHKAWRDDSVYIKDWIDIYRLFVKDAERKHPQLDDEALALECGHDLAKKMLSAMEASFDDRRLFEVENNPYERTEGFWTMLASILPAWRRRFPLSPQQISALLQEFDAAYDESWRTLLRDLSLTGLFRFTPAVMKKIRDRIAAPDDQHLVQRPPPPSRILNPGARMGGAGFRRPSPPS